LGVEAALARAYDEVTATKTMLDHPVLLRHEVQAAAGLYWPNRKRPRADRLERIGLISGLYRSNPEKSVIGSATETLQECNEPLNGNAGSLERVLACVLNDESRNRCPRLGRQRLPAYFSLRPLRGQSHNKLAFGDPAQPSRRVHSQR
jgi:hypothetical protein